jgi:uncharacterized membrane protein
MNGYLTVSLVALAGAALFEAALVPGLVIGGVAFIAPAVLPKRARRPRRRAPVNVSGSFPAPPTRRLGLLAPIRAAHKIEITQSLLKTITFRIAVTGFDFAGGYLILGDPLIAAGLSGASLIAGPFFYFLHEALWNYYGPANGAVAVRLPLGGRGGQDEKPDESEFKRVSRAIAKTVTFRAAATIPDFTVNFLVIGDAAAAAGLSAYGFVIGPIIYFGHEKAWEVFAARGSEPLAPPAPAPQGG